MTVNLSKRRNLRHSLWFYRRLLEWQREAPHTTPLTQRTAMWRAGFRSVSSSLYDLSPEHAHEYLPDTVRLRTYSSSKASSTLLINGSFARGVLDDKLLFTSLLSRQLPIPRIVAVVERGEVFAQGRSSRAAGDVLKFDVLKFAESRKSVVLKPSDGSRGKGVYRLDYDPEPTLNGRAVTPAEVREFVRHLDNYLVTETVQQARYARAICPATTNTVRVVTIIDPETNEPFVARAVHRFGTSETQPTDNWSRGGLCTLVDLKTGKLGPAVKHPQRTEGKLRWRSHHPDTGEAIEGVYVPRWEELCSALLDAVRSAPFLKYVGWDVAVTDQGFSVIEGNKNTDFDLLQVHGGLLRDPRVRHFYEHHGVIR